MHLDHYIVQGHIYSILRENYFSVFQIIFATLSWKNKNNSFITYIRRKKKD